MPSSEVVSQLLGLLYCSSAEPEQWPRFIEALSRETGATCGFVVAVGEENVAPFYSEFGFDFDFQKAYQSLFRCHDITLDRFLEAGKDGGWVGVRQALISDSELDRSLFYNDFLRSRNIYHQAGMNLGRTGGYPHAGISLLRPRACGEFEEGTVRLLRLLAPHVAQAFHLHQRMVTLTCAKEALLQGSESTGLALLALDGKGMVLVATPEAERLVAEHGGVKLRKGRVHAARPEEDEKLWQLVRRAAGVGAGADDPSDPSDAMGPGGAMMLSGLPLGRLALRRLQAVVVPFHSDSRFLGSQPSAILFLSDPDARPVARGLILRQLYQLTPCEAALVDWLTRGLNLKQAAEQMRITENSVRSMSKSVFRKTGARSQSGLMKTVLHLPGVASEGGTAAEKR